MRNEVAAHIEQLIDGQSLPDEPRHKALVLYSGGLDSVSVLYSLLESTQLDIHAHHLEIVNFENRAAAESAAINRQLAYFRKECREFEYSTSRNEFMLGKGGGVDTVLTLFTGARVHAALGSPFWTIWTGHIMPPEWEIIEGAALLNAMFVNKRFRPIWMRPLRRMKKPAILEALPPDLAETVWYCRTPVTSEGGFEPCDACHACKSHAAALQSLSAASRG